MKMKVIKLIKDSIGFSFEHLKDMKEEVELFIYFAL